MVLLYQKSNYYAIREAGRRRKNADSPEEVMEAFGLTSTINLIRPVQQQRAEAIYVTKIQGKEYELPVGEVMLEE